MLLGFLGYCNATQRCQRRRNILFFKSIYSLKKQLQNPIIAKENQVYTPLKKPGKVVVTDGVVEVVVGPTTTVHVLLSTKFLTSGRLEKFHA